jgi:hypothetical protein
MKPPFRTFKYVGSETFYIDKARSHNLKEYKGYKDPYQIRFGSPYKAPSLNYYMYSYVQ